MPQLPQFREPALLRQAMTHRSYLNEHPEVGENNERLEFLGDSLLGFLVGSWLYKRAPEMPEGDLTRCRSTLVDEQQLAKFALKLGLDQEMRLGRGVEQQGGRRLSSLLSNTFEAVIGAYFLDSGVEAVREFVETLLTPVADSLFAHPCGLDAKSRFQQWVLANLSRTPPEYRIVDDFGPDHAKEFMAEVSVDGEVYGSGQGRSKQAAEKAAAEQALRRVGQS